MQPFTSRLVPALAVCVLVNAVSADNVPRRKEKPQPPAPQVPIPGAAAPPPIGIRKDPDTGLTNVFFHSRLNVDQVATLKQRQDLGTLFLSTIGQPVTDEDLKLIAEVPMRRLNLKSAVVTDRGIAHLKGHPQLESILLEGVNITNEGVTPLAAIPNLTKVQFFISPIGDAGLAKLAQMPKLRELLFTECAEITNEGVISLSRLTHLERLGIVNSPKVTGRVIEPLGNLKELTSLGLGGIKLTPEDAKHLVALTKLTSLSLRSADINDEVVTELSQISSLETLNLSNTRVTDVGLRDLPNLTKCKRLLLSNTDVTAALSPQLETMKSLETLSLQETGFTMQDIARLCEKLPNLKSVYPRPASFSRR